MVSVSNIKKNWYGGLPTPKLSKRTEDDEKNPDQLNIDAANELGQYLLERGRLDPSAKTKRQASRRGRGEKLEDWMNGGLINKPTTNRERMLTLFEESLKGRWPQDPASRELEMKLFNQNQDYKKPLPYDF